MKIAFYTLGCKVNQYETQALKEKFLQRGYEIVKEEDFADVYVINTCTVTGLSDRKSRQYIRRVKRINPQSITAVIGCYAQVSPEEAKNIEGVNIVAGTNEKNKLPDYVEDYLQSGMQSMHVRNYEELEEYEEVGSITSMESRTRAFLKIQEGCDQFCSYCIIPYARGGVRSRKLSQIVAEAENLLRNGFKELVLTGINAALYGTELGFSLDEDEMALVRIALRHVGEQEQEPISGVELVICALNALQGDFRIRLSSLEPTVINAAYVKRLLRYNKLCPFLHLSLQHGSNRILGLMNRHYTRKEYLEIVKVLKEHDPGYGISTDLIVGFPGETEMDFLESSNMVLEAGFCRVHVFKYSRRQGTLAAEMKDQIPPEIKMIRSAALIKTASQSALSFFLEQIGDKRIVLFEEFDEKTGMCAGFTDNYIKVYCMSGPDLLHQFVTVELNKPLRDGMLGNQI